MTLYKLHDASQAGEPPHVHANTWHRVSLRDGTQRMTIAPQTSHIQLMCDLAALAPAPWFVLFILQIPRASDRPGRYQSPPMAPDDATNLITRFSDFLEQDARHNVWLAAPGSEITLAYDEHDLVYAYGPLDQYEAVLKRRGFSDAEPVIPNPHSHSFHPQFDDTERMIVGVEDFWVVTPLWPEDER
ncbi:MAG: hypothetical protein JWM98_301 [Thermoleophilia bacterium]|nr:hypothetical protein [Thermoleophilia bacterium]